MATSTLDIAHQEFEADVEPRDREYVPFGQFAAARLIDHVSVVADVAEDQYTVRMIGDLDLLAGFEVGRVDAFDNAECRDVTVVPQSL